MPRVKSSNNCTIRGKRFTTSRPYGGGSCGHVVLHASGTLLSRERNSVASACGRLFHRRHRAFDKQRLANVSAHEHRFDALVEKIGQRQSFSRSPASRLWPSVNR